jgi:DNA-directed RNA polymerase specialized sigma24 family protein
MEEERKGGLSAPEAYASVRAMIHGICYKFSRKYRIDAEELVSEANLAFVKAWRRWDPAKAKLTTWTHFCVSRTLCSLLAEHRKVRGRERWINGSDFAGRKPFTVEGLLGQVGEDAGEAIDAALSRTVKAGGGRKADMLANELQRRGWCGRRILDVFDEVKEVLT